MHQVHCARGRHGRRQSGGCGALRLAADIAGSSRGCARVLVAVAEASSVLSLRRPDALVAAALFGDAAVERPIFYVAAAAQATLPATEHTLSVRLGEGGYDIGISPEAPALVRGGIEGCVADMLAPLDLAAAGGGGGGGGWNWNGLFWAVHPGGRAILDSCEAALALEPGKLVASRRVLREYGNMHGATILFVLDEMRRRRDDGQEEGCEWGVTLGIGPGVTIEMMVLRAPGKNQH